MEVWCYPIFSVHTTWVLDKYLIPKCHIKRQVFHIILVCVQAHYWTLNAFLYINYHSIIILGLTEICICNYHHITYQEFSIKIVPFFKAYNKITLNFKEVVDFLFLSVVNACLLLMWCWCMKDHMTKIADLFNIKMLIILTKNTELLTYHLSCQFSNVQFNCLDIHKAD